MTKNENPVVDHVRKTNSAEAINRMRWDMASTVGFHNGIRKCGIYAIVLGIGMVFAGTSNASRAYEVFNRINGINL